MEGRLNKPLVLAMIAIALVLGVLLGVTTGIADRIFGGPTPKTIATSSLESMRAQNRLIAFVARYVSDHDNGEPLRPVSQAHAHPSRRRPLRARLVEAPAQ